MAKFNVVIQFEGTEPATPVKAVIDIPAIPDASELANGNYVLSIVDGVSTWVPAE